MKKVAILYICTGTYDVFWKDFYESYQAHFLLNCEKHYFVYTDQDILYKDAENVTVIYQESLGWPDNTLMRYHMFLPLIPELKTYDYVFFMNANCQAVADITEEEFLPSDEEGVLVVKHPGFYAKPRRKFTYDRSKKSLASVGLFEGKYYVCGGVNGGTSQAFCNLIEELDRRILEDKEKGIIALWHDESHINRYIIDYPTYRVLSPSFCFPEGWEMPFEPKILIREKSKWIDVKSVKGE